MLTRGVGDQASTIPILKYAPGRPDNAHRWVRRMGLWRMWFAVSLIAMIVVGALLPLHVNGPYLLLIVVPPAVCYVMTLVTMTCAAFIAVDRRFAIFHLLLAILMTGFAFSGPFFVPMLVATEIAEQDEKRRQLTD